MKMQDIKFEKKATTQKRAGAFIRQAFNVYKRNGHKYDLVGLLTYNIAIDSTEHVSESRYFSLIDGGTTAESQDKNITVQAFKQMVQAHIAMEVICL